MWECISNKQEVKMSINRRKKQLKISRKECHVPYSFVIRMVVFVYDCFIAFERKHCNIQTPRALSVTSKEIYFQRNGWFIDVREFQ